MSAPYQLVEALHAHDGPIRCVSIGPNNEILTGCQSDAPNFRVWRMSSSGELTEASSTGSGAPGPGAPGAPVYHDHWVVAITALAADPSREYCPEVCAVCCVLCGVWSVRVWSVECAVCCVLCAVWGVGCGVWSVLCAVWSVGCGVWE
jgi:WD40 repeat protein